MKTDKVNYTAFLLIYMVSEIYKGTQNYENITQEMFSDIKFNMIETIKIFSNQNGKGLKEYLFEDYKKLPF